MANINSLSKEIIDSNLDPRLIERAFEFAKKAHEGQKRVSGEDFIWHPLRAAEILTKMKLDSKTIAAGLLHDVADDTAFTISDIEKEFDREIAFLVEGVSKLGKLRYSKTELDIKPIEKRLEGPVDSRAENLRKMFFAMAEDLRVILIKLADRLDNMKTLQYLPEEKQKRIALETLEIFAPLAGRLGMGETKGQLEDLSFPYLYPKEYQWLLKNVKGKYEERKKYLNKAKPVILKILAKEGIKPAYTDVRAKHYWSLYQKFLKHEMDLEKIYDLVALRLIVDDVASCYKTVGIIHKFWKPLPGRIKDYIATPKPTGYQSLHTTIFCLDGKITEIQIRTTEMHQEAEYGIAAHWARKEGIALKTQKRKFAWVSQLRDWQKGVSESKEFLEGLKIDFFKNRIFVFTPKGEVIDLPEEATPVDFAYAVHTEIGNKCAGAKINGKIASLSYPLKNGDVVEIIIDKNKKPSRDWLEFAKTSFARSRIKDWFRKKSRPENLDRGLTALNKEIQSIYGTTFEEIPSAKKEKLLKQFLYKDIETLLTKIGEGEISTRQVTRMLFEEREVLKPLSIFQPKPRVEAKEDEVLISGEKGILTKLANCCFPKPGQEILAYITKDKGASIHRTDCQNLQNQEEKWPGKIIQAFWQGIQMPSYKARLQITSEDRLGLLKDVAETIAGCGVNILGHHSELQSKGEPALIEVEVEIKRLEELEKLLNRLTEVKSVISAKRVS